MMHWSEAACRIPDAFTSCPGPSRHRRIHRSYFWLIGPSSSFLSPERRQHNGLADPSEHFLLRISCLVNLTISIVVPVWTGSFRKGRHRRAWAVG